MDSFAPGDRLRLPLMVVGGVAALALIERLQLWQSGGGFVVLGLMLALPLGCAGLGALGARWLTGLDRVLAARLLVGALALLGAGAFVAVQMGWWVVVAEAGFVALLLGPALVLLVLSTLRPQARTGSLLARASERVRWGVVGGVACAGALLALPDWYGLREFYGSGTLVVWLAAVAALVTLGLCALSSAWDLRRARRALQEEASLQPVAAGHVSSGTRLLDIGVGNRMLGEVTSDGASAYRACEHVSRVVVGDPGIGASRLARAHRKLIWGCFAAVTCVAVGAVGAVAAPRAAEPAAAASAEPKPPLSERAPLSPGLRTLTPP